MAFPALNDWNLDEAAALGPWVEPSEAPSADCFELKRLLKNVDTVLLTLLLAGLRLGDCGADMGRLSLIAAIIGCFGLKGLLDCDA